MKNSRLTGKILLMGLFTLGIALYSCTKEEDVKKEDPPPPKVAPEVTTASVSGITQTTATGGGEVTNEGTSPVTARGICWDTLQNPTIVNSRTTNGSGLGNFVSQMSGLTGGMKYYVRAYAISTVDTVYGQQVEFETTPIPFSCGMNIKYEGKNYRTVQIGTQCWFKDNLDVGTFVSSTTTGSSHSNVANNSTIEKYCYNNDIANCAEYGGLYDWDEMMGYTTTPSAQGICPDGWHIPSDDEWIIMINGLGGSATAGGKMKEAGTAHWTSPNIGANNSSNFTALPGGFRANVGAFQNINTYGYFWSSSTGSGNTAYYISLYFNSQSSSRNNYERTHGFSVRCVQD